MSKCEYREDKECIETDDYNGSYFPVFVDELVVC